MILYIIKTMACSALFLLLYKLLLEGAKMNHFKRFYLLFCSLLSLILPALRFPAQSHQTVYYLPAALYRDNLVTLPVRLPIMANIDVADIIIAMYILVSLALTFRFFRNIYLLHNHAGAGSARTDTGIQVILSDKVQAPYSFLNRIFVPAREFLDGTIDERIMRHEAAHIRQKHSLDIIFIELLRIAAWYNPLLFGYKKAIQLNHEFLADQFVIEQYPDRTGYQNLMLLCTKQNSGFQLSSSFNFFTTKKRLLMITQNTSARTMVFKITLIAPIMAACIYLLPGRAYAQGEQPLRASVMLTQKNDQKSSGMYITDVIIEPRVPLSTRSRPTRQQMTSWKDSRLFGLWIDGEKVPNESLGNYANTDFSQAVVSAVTGKEKEFVNYQYMVDLMTNGYYRKLRDRLGADSGRSVISVRTLEREKK